MKGFCIDSASNSVGLLDRWFENSGCLPASAGGVFSARRDPPARSSSLQTLARAIRASVGQVVLA